MHDCPDSCAWTITTDGGRAVTLEGDPHHPLTRGSLCEKMDGFLTDVVYNPDRILYPLRRVGPKGEGRFERASWDEALDGVASRLQAVIEEHGPAAILPYSFYGTEGMVQAYSLDRRFFARLGATRLERSICGSTAAAGLKATLGTDTGILPEDIEASRLILVWGANPVVGSPHSWAFIEKARENGARVVVIDPLRSATAARADWHLQPLPGTDAALALGMMHVIVREDLEDRDYVERYTLGFDRLRERLAEYPPDRVAGLTGLEPGQIVELARAYATTRPATIRTQIAMEKHANGAMMYRSIACLPALVGAWRDKGGGLLLFSSAFFEEALNFSAVMMPDLEGPSVRSVNMAQLGRVLTDEALAPPIQATIVYNANPAVIAPDHNRVLEGLGREDLLTVVLDHFVTDTARYADYVFPATTQAEHLDLIAPWGSRYLSLNLPAIEPRGEALPNTEFFRRLARRLGLEEPYLYASDEEIVRTALESDHPYLSGITFERLHREGWAPMNIPEPWIPFAAGGFPTPSGKCELYAESLIEKGLDPLPLHDPLMGAPTEVAALYPLTFMSPKSQRYFLNSSHANQPRHLQAAGEPRLQIHPDDAARRGIASGDTVRAYNARGSVELAAEVSDGTRPGLVAMAHGWWPSLVPGGSTANALTSDGLSDLGGGAALYDARVEVEKTA
jgi:anaerobic selenocysteine-containing dehydrogenase